MILMNLMVIVTHQMMMNLMNLKMKMIRMEVVRMVIKRWTKIKMKVKMMKWNVLIQSKIIYNFEIIKIIIKYKKVFAILIKPKIVSHFPDLKTSFDQNYHTRA